MNHKQSEMIIQTLKTMKLQVQMVTMSHLSDVQELIRFGALEQVRRELNFVKSLMLEYPDPRLRFRRRGSTKSIPVTWRI